VTFEERLEDTHRRYRSDAVWQTLSNTSGGNWKCSVAEGR